MHLSSFCSLAASCKKCSAYSGWSKELLDVLKVLLRKYFCRSHDTRLIAIANSYQSAQERNHCLSATHISLQKTIHLMAALEIVTNLSNHTFLSTSEREGEGFITFVECLTNLRHHNTVVGPASDIFLFKQRKLQIEELLKFQTILGLFQGSSVLRKMDISDSKM